jgi:hypothetical protein
MPWPFYPLERDPVPIVQEAGRAPGLVWMGVENLAPTGVRSPDHPAHSESLYWLCYPGHVSLGCVLILSSHLCFCQMNWMKQLWVVHRHTPLSLELSTDFTIVAGTKGSKIDTVQGTVRQTKHCIENAVTLFAYWAEERCMQGFDREMWWEEITWKAQA